MSDFQIISENIVKEIEFRSEAEARLHASESRKYIRQIIQNSTNSFDISIFDKYAGERVEAKSGIYLLLGDFLIKDIDGMKKIIDNDNIFGKAIFLYYIYPYLFKAARVNRDHQSIQSIANVGRVARDGAPVEIIDHFVGKLAFTDQVNNVLDVDLRGEIKRISHDLTKIEGNISSYENEFDELKHLAEDKMTRMIAEIGGKIELFEKDIESIRSYAIEKEKLKGIEAIWSKKEYVHKIISRIGLAIIVSMLFAFPILVMYHWPSIKIEYLELVKQSGGLLTVPLFVVPVLALAWALRIINKVVMNEFVLADDASQRTALLKTYYMLVGDEDAKMQQGDRLLVLNALFRPLPGHQNEEISPPNFSDLLKEMINKKDG